ncbi:hypothetical protein ACHAXM_001921 [Skeletonema potamos]
MNELDDSLIYHYNLQSVTDLKQPLTVTMPLVTATPSGGEGHDGNNKEESTMKYEAGPNYSRSHPKMKNIVTPAAVKIRDALSVILSRGLTINVTVDNIMDMSMDDADYSDDDNDDDASYYDDPQTHGSEYNEDFAKEYPLLSRFALPLFNTGDDDPFKRAACTRSNMLRELVWLMGSCGDEIKFESLNSRHTTKLLPVGSKPTTNHLDALFKAEDNDATAVESILKYLTQNCSTELQAELRKLKLIPKLLDEYDIAALIDHANLDITEWKKVVQALKAFQDVKCIGASVDKWTEIGKAAGEVFYEEWIHEKEDDDGTTKEEKIKYWWKDTVSEVTSMLGSILNGYWNLKPEDIEFIYLCHGGDHGKAKFRFTTKLIVQFKEGGPCIERLLPVGDILCKKDSAEVLRSTLIPKLADGVNRLAKDDLIFKKDEDEKWCVTLGAAEPTSKKPTGATGARITTLVGMIPIAHAIYGL